MSVENPYCLPQYSEKKLNAEKCNMSHKADHSVLLAEPRELDNLFECSTFLVKHDICFPERRQSESTIVDSAQIQNQTLVSSSTSNTTSSSSSSSSFASTTIANTIKSKNINFSALSWFKQNDTQLVSSKTQNPSLYSANDLKKYQPISHHVAYRYTYYYPDTGYIHGKTLLDLKLPGISLEDLLRKKNYWIDVTSPFMDELKAISRLFHIHPFTTEEIMSHDVREKCDIFRHYIFICYRAFLYGNQKQLNDVRFYNILTKDILFAFHFGDVPHIYHVQQRVHQLQDYIKIVPDWINYALMDEITDSFAPVIQQIESEVDEIDDLVVLYKTDQSDMILRIGSCRKKVIQMVRLLATKVEVLRDLIKRLEERTKESGMYHKIEKSHEEEDDDDDKYDKLSTRIYPDVRLYLGDVQDHILTMLQNLNHYVKVLDRSESSYVARISIELAQTSNSTNQFIGRLTLFATVLLPMNLVTGLWGMNVKVPGKEHDNLVYFSWLVFGLIVYAIISLSLAKKRISAIEFVFRCENKQ